jgi:hypothetical protein
MRKTNKQTNKVIKEILLYSILSLGVSFMFIGAIINNFPTFTLGVIVSFISFFTYSIND